MREQSSHREAEAEAETLQGSGTSDGTLDASGATGLARARELADQRGMELYEREGSLVLRHGKMELAADFSRLLPRLRPDRLSRELLVRACRVRAAGPDAQAAPVALDATAGLGEDALLLAAAGFELLLYERDPVVAALLADGLRRARLDPRLSAAAQRMRIAGGDSIPGMRELACSGARVDVVLLDPMFPGKRKDAATKKKLQLIQRLERPCDDETALMDAALALHPRKVVVKRPLKGPCLAGVKPSSALAGKVVRYDVIVPARA